MHTAQFEFLSLRLILSKSLRKLPQVFKTNYLIVSKIQKLYLQRPFLSWGELDNSSSIPLGVEGVFSSAYSSFLNRFGELLSILVELVLVHLFFDFLISGIFGNQPCIEVV